MKYIFDKDQTDLWITFPSCRYKSYALYGLSGMRPIEYFIRVVQEESTAGFRDEPRHDTALFIVNHYESLVHEAQEFLLKESL